MKPATIHHLNTGLIILSCLVAFFIPFELFLFSYGILGPLHYLTEIGWLHKKNYFTKGKYDFVFLAIACVMLVYYNYNPPLSNYGITADIIFFSLLSCLAFVFIKDWLYRIIVLVMSLVCISFLNNSEYFFIWVGVFLPTIIHVLIFTWAFMLFGVLKERSGPGLVSVIVLVLCSILILTYHPSGLYYQVSDYAQKSYEDFGDLNYYLINYFSMEKLTDIREIFTSKTGFVIMRFIAFAYTYHYLNWFSKTSVIKWHQVPKPTLAATIALWLLSVMVYVYDYGLGLKILFFLSFLHVFLEFPLNIVSFTGIGKAMISLGKKQA